MVVTFGEIMLRLSPPGYQRMTQAKSLEMTFGGGEANVAVSLAGFGQATRFVTKLPKNDIGEACIRELRSYGVDISSIARGGERIGIYFCEKGASQRPSKVIYDRANSAIASSLPKDYNWDEIFDGATWFHFTGITPALGDTVAEITLTACKEAKKRNITISCDLNYRKKLWSREKAKSVMTPLMEYVNILIANEEDITDVFGINIKGSDIVSGEINIDEYKHVAKQLINKFEFDKLAITLRESISASFNNWSALLCTKEGEEEEAILSEKYAVQIVDRVGGGDSFCGGLIYALLNNYNNKDALEFAVAASCLKHSIEGDFNIVSVEEVKALAGGDGSGRVQR